MKNLFSLLLMFAVVAFFSTDMNAQAAVNGVPNGLETITIGSGKTAVTFSIPDEGLQLTPEQAERLRALIAARNNSVTSAGVAVGVIKSSGSNFDVIVSNDKDGGKTAPIGKRHRG